MMRRSRKQIFLEEKVDVAVVEVGIGGRYDATNVIDQPVVCGITNLGPCLLLYCH